MDKPRVRRRAFGIAAVLLLILAGVALTQMPLVTPFSPAPRIGSRMLDFTLPATTGESVSTTQFVGQVLIVNFWATWCVPCRQEMPALQEIYDAHREHGLVLLGVDYGEDREQVVNYARELGVSFPLLLDRDTAVGQRYRVQGLPTTVFVDRQGIIRDVVVGGPMNILYIEAKILPLLDEK
ncbi:MAG: TlpA family protein disulfide reductase [Chloroflexi bacterium]|nr:TlpA family protein disulfide reductase [Chloroflexota bacterium]